MIHQLISNNFLAQKYGKRLDNRTQSGEKLWYSQLIYTWMNIVHKVLKLKSSKWVLAITQILWETYTIKCDHHKTPTPISGPHPHQRSRSHSSWPVNDLSVHTFGHNVWTNYLRFKGTFEIFNDIFLQYIMLMMWASR